MFWVFFYWGNKSPQRPHRNLGGKSMGRHSSFEQTILLKINKAFVVGRIVPKKNSWHCECLFLKSSDTVEVKVFFFLICPLVLPTYIPLSFTFTSLWCIVLMSPVKQMAYIYPRLYNCSVPAPFLADLPQLAQLCGGTKPQLSSDRRVEQIFSMQGEKFVSFAKSEKFVDGKTSNKDTNGWEASLQTWQPDTLAAQSDN